MFRAHVRAASCAPPPASFRFRSYLSEATPEETPRLEIFLPAARYAGAATQAVVVLPGGGYGRRAPHEGEAIGRFFAARGIVAHYRVAPHRFPSPVADACRAVRLARSLAGDLGFDSDKLALMGFSSGGHLAATVGTQPELHRDAHDDLPGSARPDRLVLCCGVLSLLGPHGHGMSARNFLGGEENFTDENECRFDGPAHVTADTPPTFLFHTADDGSVPVQQSLNFAAACAVRGVPFALHVYTRGVHGVGLAPDDPALRGWPELLAAWLKSPL